MLLFWFFFIFHFFIIESVHIHTNWREMHLQIADCTMYRHKETDAATTDIWCLMAQEFTSQFFSFFTCRFLIGIFIYYQWAGSLNSSLYSNYIRWQLEFSLLFVDFSNDMIYSLTVQYHDKIFANIVWMNGQNHWGFPTSAKSFCHPHSCPATFVYIIITLNFKKKGISYE